ARNVEAGDVEGAGRNIERNPVPTAAAVIAAADLRRIHPPAAKIRSGAARDGVVDAGVDDGVVAVDAIENVVPAIILDVVVAAAAMDLVVAAANKGGHVAVDMVVAAAAVDAV